MVKKARKQRQDEKKSTGKKTFFSERQKKVLLFVLVVMLVAVPVIDMVRTNLHCKAECLKRKKTPYPEIACKYDCPWPWEKNK